MPSHTAVFDWLEKYPDMLYKYARARESQADVLFDEILEIVDDATNDWMERRDDDQKAIYVLNGEHVQRSRLRVDARKWMAGKLRPKVYGEKIIQEHTGANGTALFQTVYETRKEE
jgi:hypothetical protein